jgi:siroheme synthase-like protein
LAESLLRLVRQGLVEWDNSLYAPGKLQALAPSIVFAATNSPTVNDQVITEARSLGILVDGSDFSSMAVVRRGPIIFAVGTSGASPALAVHLREKLEASFGDEYSLLAMWLAYLRPCVQNQIPDAHQRQNLWHDLIHSQALVHLQQGDVSAACSVINTLLEQNGIQERL